MPKTTVKSKKGSSLGFYLNRWIFKFCFIFRYCLASLPVALMYFTRCWWGGGGGKESMTELPQAQPYYCTLSSSSSIFPAFSLGFTIYGHYKKLKRHWPCVQKEPLLSWNKLKHHPLGIYQDLKNQECHEAMGKCHYNHDWAISYWQLNAWLKQKNQHLWTTLHPSYKNQTQTVMNLGFFGLHERCNKVNKSA